MFEHAVWQHDRMTLDGLVFRIEHNRTDAWEPGQQHFRFYKTKPLVEQYEEFFRRHSLDAKNIFELGLWDGGSLAFWCEGFKPKKIVGIDIEDRTDSEYFAQYVTNRNLRDRLSTYWKTSQTDTETLKQIIRKEFDEPLDLVFDDASHLYKPTKTSFEALLPFVRPGGLYVIEDWAWNHWADFRRPKNWNPNDHLTRLVVELIEAAGTNRGAIAAVTVAPGFVAVERGPRALSESFRLADQVYERQEPIIDRVMTRLLWGPEREALSRLKKRFASKQ